MFIYECNLELHDNLFFSSREYGSLYECEHYIHNYALTYAISSSLSDDLDLRGILPLPSYFCSPNKREASYKEDLEPLNNSLYVTPAKPINYEMDLNSINCGDEDNFIKFGIKKKGYTQDLLRSFGIGDKKNKPSYSKIKEVSVGSKFSFFIFSRENINLPNLLWIRLGKWMSKAMIDIKIIDNKVIKEKKGRYIANHSLNQRDISNEKLFNFDLISMPPSNLINNATITGEYLEFEKENKTIVRLPKDLQYKFK